MRLRFQTTHLRVLLFAATLLVGQWLLAQHLAQVEAHATGDSCEWCLTHAPLAGAVPVAAPLPVAPTADHRPWVMVTVTPAAGFRFTHAARAPPRFLLV